MTPLTPRHFGAVGDDRTDDRAALQRAFDWAVNENGLLDLGDRWYAIDGPLSIGSKTPAQAGHFSIFGSGGWIVAGKRGARLRIRGTGHSAVVRVEEQPLFRFSLADFAVVSDQQDGAAFGVLFDGTKFQQPEVVNVHAKNVDTAFGIKASAANGEFINFHRVSIDNVRRVFSTNAGQAFRHIFYQPCGFVRMGGTLFEFEDFGGFGLRVIEPNITFLPYVSGDWHAWIRANFASLPQSTVLKLTGGTTDPITIEGGRIEHASTLIEHNGGSWNLLNRITFREMSLDGMTSHESRPVIRSTRDGSLNDFEFDRLAMAAFWSVPGRVPWAMSVSPANGDLYNFNRCGIDNFVGVLQSAADPILNEQVRYRQCRVTDRRDDGSHASKPTLVSN